MFPEKLQQICLSIHKHFFYNLTHCFKKNFLYAYVSEIVQISKTSVWVFLLEEIKQHWPTSSSGWDKHLSSMIAQQGNKEDHTLLLN